MTALANLREAYDDQTQGVLDDELSDLTISVGAGDLYPLVHGFPFDALVEELAIQAIELRAQGNANDAELMDKAATALASFSGDAQ